jgi:sporulation protein YlmC with PRC-barrel domain
MWPIEKLLGMPAVTIRDGRRLGTLEGVEIDPATSRIAYLRLERPSRREPVLVPWEAVQSVGTDVILIASEAALLHEVPEADRPHLTPHVGDRPVVSVSGDKLGSISSYDVDEATGAIVRYRIGGLLAGLFGSSVTFPPAAIRTFGRDAILVDDAVVSGTRRADHNLDEEQQLLEEDGIGAARARQRQSARQ